MHLAGPGYEERWMSAAGQDLEVGLTAAGLKNGTESC